MPYFQMRLSCALKLGIDSVFILFTMSLQDILKYFISHNGKLNVTVKRKYLPLLIQNIQILK